MKNVYIDPDGSGCGGLFVIVAAATGVTYETQCGGLRCLQRSLEGFLVPCPSEGYELGTNAEADLISFFVRRYRGRPPESLDDWPEDAAQELTQLVANVAFWMTPIDAEPSRLRLAIDTARFVDCTEAWIPVVTPYGIGVLTFDNSD